MAVANPRDITDNYLLLLCILIFNGMSIKFSKLLDFSWIITVQRRSMLLFFIIGQSKVSENDGENISCYNKKIQHMVQRKPRCYHMLNIFG